MSDVSAQQRRRGTALPVSLPPRGLSRAQAAEYVGVSPSTFDKLVAGPGDARPEKSQGAGDLGPIAN
jgi:hypothetical protein